jgi:hypothetical protein
MTEGKTCNGDCYCQYKTIGGTFFGCQYSGYCDFQAPRDSRTIKVDAIGKECSQMKCTCGQTIPCPIHRPGFMDENSTGAGQ